MRDFLTPYLDSRNIICRVLSSKTLDEYFLGGVFIVVVFSG